MLERRLGEQALRQSCVTALSLSLLLILKDMERNRTEHSVLGEQQSNAQSYCLLFGMFYEGIAWR